MVVANAVAAWIYGAGVNNGMLPGIGEWAGNVPIEALVVGTVGLGTPLMGLLLDFIFMVVNALIISLDLISYGFSRCCLGCRRGYEA